MTLLRLNREFAIRHLGVAALMLAMSGWFGYDGFVNYPRQDESYFETRHLKRDAAIERQKEFMVLAFLASLIIAAHVFAISRLRFAFDDRGFEANGTRHDYGDVKDVDWSKWDKHGIVRFKAGNRSFKLDAWHHTGVREFAGRIRQ